MLTAANTPDMPSSTDLREAPELAALHLLGGAIDVAVQALRAARLDPPGPDATVSPRRHLVVAMLPLLRALAALLLEYRHALLDERRDLHGALDDLPY
jgi:hypothetical protein